MGWIPLTITECRYLLCNIIYCSFEFEMVLARMFGWSTLKAVRGRAYETSRWTNPSMSRMKKVCAEGLECHVASEVSLMHSGGS